MTLRIITGGASKARSNFVLNEIKQKLTQTPAGRPIFYIVPEQMTFQQEYKLFNDDEVKGSTRAQVVSFSRLAWRVLQETGGSTRQFISSTGTQMMLRKIMEQSEDGFHIFQKAIDKHGFLQELEGMITEFKRHCISPSMLEEHIPFTQENISLQYKLKDLHYIYHQLSGLFANKYIDGEDQLQLLTEKISTAYLFQQSEIYIDGFHRFTPKEFGIIAELLKVSRQISVVLTVHQEGMGAETNELDLFHQTKETYKQLRAVAEEEQITIADDVVLGEKDQRFFNAPYINHLEDNFDERPAPPFISSQPNPFQLREAVHPRAELEGVIQEILRLTREHHYRYRDMVIYLRDSSQYNDLIQTLFNDYHIPVFIDEKRSMLNHPFIEFIRSLFDVVETNWRYDAVFRLLKTGFIPATDEQYPLTRDAIDELENYCLEYGVRSKSQWLSKGNWNYQRFKGFDQAAQTDYEKEQELKINAYRNQVVFALKGFNEKIKKQATPEEYCEALYLLIEQLDIPTKLEENRAAFDEQGKLEKAREEEQVWQSFIHLLDEIVEMIGQEEMSYKLFKQTFEAGLESLEFSHVPPSMDHVIVGSIDHSRIDDKKCSFLLGVNEGYWPMKPPIDGIINEQEREFLKRFGMELAASNRRVLLDDHFYMYLAFTTAPEYVWVSYVISDNEGKGRLPSQMIHRLQEFFPDLGRPVLLSDPDELVDAERFITTTEKTRAALTVQLARYLRGYPLRDIWRDVLLWYMEHEPKNETTYQVLQSLFYENRPKPLTNETVAQLYPKHVKTSVSRLEMLYRCSYQHFVQYNLNLQNRRTYKLDAPDIGQLFHEAIKTITEWIKGEGKDFTALTEKDAGDYAKKSIAHLAPVLQHQILSSSNRYKYIKKKLEDVIAKATYILSEQARRSGFSPIGIELSFGMDRGLDPVKIALPNGYELYLRGRIDRVDSAESQEDLYLRIIDYKSSSRGLELADVYYGLALQMLTYLHVILTQSKQWIGREATPAGILYFHIHDAMLQESSQLGEDEIAEKIFKQYKMNGLINADEEIARLMDTTLDTGYSDVVPIALKKDGSFYTNSKVTDQNTFQVLQQHLEHLIVQAGLDITSGKIKLNPYENNKGNACTFCDFKSVCQFDPLLKENNFRRLAPLKESEVVDKMEVNLSKGGVASWSDGQKNSKPQ